MVVLADILNGASNCHTDALPVSIRAAAEPGIVIAESRFTQIILDLLDFFLLFQSENIFT